VEETEKLKEMVSTIESFCSELFDVAHGYLLEVAYHDPDQKDEYLRREKEILRITRSLEKSAYLIRSYLDKTIEVIE